jgi:2-oxoglutarate dehydrogenase E2 component (dihydrolipoamide succinyltransferase)
MAIELRVPAVGESITEVEIGDWLKAAGEPVSQDDPVVMIETDKVTVELPAPVNGVVTQMLKKKGEHAAVGEVIGYMEARDVAGAGGNGGPRPDAAAPKAEPHVMPGARRVLEERGIAPADVPGSGPGGRVLKEDALRAVPAPARAPAPPRPVAPGGPRQEEVVPMTPLRRRIAERLVQAQQAAALLTTFNECDMSAVLALRAAHKEAFQA